MNEVIDFTKNGDDGDSGGASELVRQQSWTVSGPAELELAVDVGRIRIHLDDPVADRDSAEGGTGEVRVEIRHDPGAGGGWAQGLSGILNWLGTATATGSPGADATELAAQAVQAAEITWSEAGRRLVVRSSTELPLRVVPLAVTVHAPAGSRLAARTGSGDVTVTGHAAWATVRTGSGEARIEAVDGDADVTTGSGDIDLGRVTGRARLRTGSGAIALADAAGPTEIRAGSGDVVVGAVSGDLGVRTGSGEVSISDARAGHLELTTGSGELRIGVHPGVAAELDLSSGSGRARSELDVSSVSPEQQPALRVRGRTGSGEVLVTRASVPV